MSLGISVPRLTNVELRAGVSIVEPNAQITFANAGLSINYINTGLSITRNNLQTGVSYANLYSQTVWANVRADGAELDHSGLIRFIYDTISLADSPLRDLGRPVASDTSLLDDVTSLHPSKGLSSNNFAFLEAISLLITYERAYADALTPSDVAVINTALGLSDSITLTDSLDEIALGYGIEPADSASFSDDHVLSIAYVISEGFTIDDMSASDDLDIDTVIYKSNVFGFSDTLAIGNSRFITDSLSVGDSVQTVTYDVFNSTVNAGAINAFAING